ncbi:DUF1684 domain-containing protein [Clavibacter sp. Sh2126]|uniref:DUF1684 domain-containing protein n=1 Tax=Clavibacter sp. Sh2126 TaxID=3397678 RepID=UPI0039DF76E7
MTDTRETPARPAASDADPAAAALAEAALAEYEAWHRARLAAVTSPFGSLALIQTTWLEPGQEVSDLEALEGQPDTVQLTRIERISLDTGEPEYGYRLWDAASPKNRAFVDIEVYPYAPEWILEGRFERVDDDRVIPFEHIADAGRTRELPVPGDIVVTIEGEEVRLSAFADGDRLQLVFADATTGRESYAPSRFLFLPRPDGDGPVTLDFTRAVVPPCGFSDWMNCPLPPAGNRLAAAVRAGERGVVYRDEA